MASDMRLSDVIRNLEDHGWLYVRISQNSHAVFEKPGRTPCVIPFKKKKVKACYASKIRKACDS
jgi:predicted RNA binding protein YcfA (HicA-like mRNA interferase family)